MSKGVGKMAAAKKTVKIVLIVILALILVVTGMVHFIGDRALKAAIETVGSEVLQVPVTLDSISFSILRGTVDVKNLVVGNPEGYDHENLLELNEMHLDANIMSFLSDTGQIRSIKLDGMNVVMEQKGMTNNIKQVLDSLPKTGEDEPAEKPTKDSDKKTSSEKKLIIDELEISNVTVKVKPLPIPGKAATLSIPVPTIKMTDLGKEKNLDIAGFVHKIFTSIVEGIAKAGSNILPDDMLGSLSEQGKALVESSKKALEKGSDIGKDLLESTKDLGEGLTEGLKGLFKKKDE